MSVSCKMVSMVVLPVSLVLGGVGCVAGTDEAATEPDTVAADEAAPPTSSATAQAEQTGTAAEACGGFGGFNGYYPGYFGGLGYGYGYGDGLGGWGYPYGRFGWGFGHCRF